MTNMTNLAEQSCAACEGVGERLSDAQIADLKSRLHTDWVIAADGQSLSREFAVKGFAKAVYLANLAAYLSDGQGHHADVAFGWGYCRVTYTSHELGRLSQNDFICAAKFDEAVA